MTQRWQYLRAPPLFTLPHLLAFSVWLMLPGASQWGIYYYRMWGQLSTTCSNLVKQPNLELQVTVDSNKLRTRASETVGLIGWLHLPPSWAVLPERHVHIINRWLSFQDTSLSSMETWEQDCWIKHFYLERFWLKPIIRYKTHITYCWNKVNKWNELMQGNKWNNEHKKKKKKTFKNKA